MSKETEFVPKKSTHMWVDGDGEFYSYRPGGVKTVRHKLMPDPEPEPPPKPELVWFEYRGETYAGMWSHGFGGLLHLLKPVCIDARRCDEQMLTSSEIEEMGIEIHKYDRNTGDNRH